jgi:hypothetical protein
MRTPADSPRRSEPADPRWLLARRIAVSRSMGRSPLLSDFLLYICDRHLRDQPSQLTEQRIGVKVFGRSEGYNSNDDNIVRNYARMLRKRVDEYFATEGREEEWILEIPRGGYAPVFSARTDATPARRAATQSPVTSLEGLTAATSSRDQPAPEQSLPDPSVPDEAMPDAPLADEPGEAGRDRELAVADLAPASEGPLPLRHRRLRVHWFVACLLLLAVCAAAGRRRVPPHRETAAPQTPEAEVSAEALSDEFWSELFQRNRDTFIVPADSGLVILQNLTERPVSLNDYIGGSYHNAAASRSGIAVTEVNELGARRYTSIVDLNLTLALARQPQVVPQRLLVRFSRDLRMDDLRSGNAILLGSVDSNPWEELFEQQLNFRFAFSPTRDTSPTIVNMHPRPGEQAVYANEQSGPWHSTYAVVAYVPSLDGSGHVLMIGGLTMAGTQAGGDFVLNPKWMEPVLRDARSASGALRSFEILIETDNVAANASRPHVVCERIGPV